MVGYNYKRLKCGPIFKEVIQNKLLLLLGIGAIPACVQKLNNNNKQPHKDLKDFVLID